MAREITLPAHIYLANQSQPSPGVGVQCCAKWVAHPRVGLVGICAFFGTIFASSHDNTLLSHLFHMELCHDDSSVIKSKDHHFLDFDCTRWNFLGRREVGLLQLFDCDFNSASQSVTHVSSIVTIRYRNAWPSTLNLRSSNVATSRHFCSCSAVKQWGTHQAQFFFFCKLFVKIRNNVDEIPAVCDISSHIAQWSCARKSATSFTLCSSVDVFGLPGLGSSFMVTHPSRKWAAQRETVLQSTVCSPQTSRKAVWISVGFMPHKVSILMYDLWSSTVTVPEALADAMSNTRQFKMAYTREVTNTHTASSSL